MTVPNRVFSSDECVRFGNAADRLYATVAKLEPDSVLVLAYLADRLLAGREAYGDLDIAKDKRDWQKELAAEAADGSIYACLDVLSKSLKDHT